MYDTFFGFQNRPFSSVPRIDRYFPAAGIEAARVALCRCVERSEGLGVLIGPTGTGKTLLCQLLAEHLKKTFTIAELSCGRLSTRRSLYQAILYSLGQAYRGMDEGELRLSLVDYLTSSKGRNQGIVLIVDEAHTLPLHLLDEIRMLTNLASGSQPLVRLLLAANGSLEERLSAPKMESFNQRISARCYLESLTKMETAEYIHGQIDLAGSSGEKLFPEEACLNVHKATDGVPRLINQLCDHALLLACVAGEQIIDGSRIEEAWADLQQLPTPWNGEKSSEKGGVIEFGRFDDSPLESGDSIIEEHFTGPSLRLTDDFEPFDSKTVEFGFQDVSDAEQSSVADAEDDFQPAGSIGPEIELTLTPTEHPFQEEFEHEEVISDRYATNPGSVSSGFEACPSVSAEEKTSTPFIAPISANEPDDTSLVAPELSEDRNVAESIKCVESLISTIATEKNDMPEKTKPISEGRRMEFNRLFAKLRQG